MGGKAKLALAVHSRGLIVTGDTYDIREMIKAEGGKWDANGKGWVFPLEQKTSLTAALHALVEVGNIEDKAIVKLVLEPCERGLMVSGFGTFQLKELLKSQGGFWDAVLKSWTFKASQKAELLAALRASRCAEVEVKSASTAVAKGNSSALVVVEPPRRVSSSAKNGDRGTGGKAAAVLSRARVALQATPARKVVESDRSLRRSERSSDGSKKAETRVQHKERKVSCKRTGAHIETQSVTKKRKVVETRGKVIETATITVKRVRRR